ncbi:hypothetical protein [Haladaptatus salinisoli]|uniref:hypothetical protein n=1 Tax=Haladaptatus salinisoli TaxID=2884876 RepID=UPI001D0A3D14|nr:hypothetical protein [Haladaptatus salinisoli]
MAKPPELWAFILTNALLFITGCLLTALSYLAYYQNPKKSSYRYSTVGFAFIVLGGLISPVYRLGIRSDYHLDASQRLILQSAEAILLALGLGLLFYAVVRHDGSSSTVGGVGPADSDFYDADDRWHRN